MRSRRDDDTLCAVNRPDSVLNILLVDDDPLVLRVLCRMLLRDGHLVHACSGGQEGIEAMKQALVVGAPFDLVVTDLDMPRVDGHCVAHEVKAVSPSTPVMLLSGWGHGLSADDTPCIDRVLAKPPRLADLRAALAVLVKPAAEAPRMTTDAGHRP